MRLDSEAYYELDTGETDGYIESPLIEKPDDGWGTLYVNCAPGDGGLQVEVVDSNDAVISGFSKTDCSTLLDSTGNEVLWQSERLNSVSDNVIRLRFVFTSGGSTQPIIYKWWITEWEAESPTVSELKVDDETEPSYIINPAPVFSWVYTDPASSAQASYKILVASSMENLQNGTGDMWDSGDVSSSVTQVTYGGSTLSNTAVYYWKVIVTNEEGKTDNEVSAFSTGNFSGDVGGLCRVYCYMYDEAGDALNSGEGLLDVTEILSRPTGVTGVLAGGKIGPAYTNSDGYVYLDVVRGSEVIVKASWPGLSASKYTEVTVPDQASYDVGSDLQ